MSKQTTFVDQEYRDIMVENIAIAIQEGVNAAGVTPEETNTFTKKIKVREFYGKTIHTRNAY